MDKGNENKHRTSIPKSGLGQVTETQKWGQETARQRYGKRDDSGMEVKDTSRPQFKIDQATGTRGHTPESWVTGKNEDATTKPGFDKSKFS